VLIVIMGMGMNQRHGFCPETCSAHDKDRQSGKDTASSTGARTFLSAAK
jgi:hypothetical protein